MAYIYPFRMASGTATILLIDPENMRVLIGVRSDDSWVYPGFNSLPGGFMESRWTDQNTKGKMGRVISLVRKFLGMKLMADEFHEGENLEECAVREIEEELGIKVDTSQLILFGVRSNSRTDTRAHVINACYYVLLTPGMISNITPGDDLKGVDWFSIEDHMDLFQEGATPETISSLEEIYPMAFNHGEIMLQGVQRWMQDHQNFEVNGENVYLRGKVKSLEEKISDMGWDLSNALGHSQGGA